MDANARILIIDDHPLMRDALEVAVRKACGARVKIVHAETLNKAKIYIPKNEPDLILLDLNLSDASGFEGLSQIKQACPSPVMIVTAQEGCSAIDTARTLGAQGYLCKNQTLEEMTCAIQIVLSGKTSFPDTLKSVNDNVAAGKISLLTPAQSRVINHLSNGLLNKQIAYKMSISEATVKAHMTAIFRKLGASNRTQALMVYRDAHNV